jgi:hypothetical protein
MSAPFHVDRGSRVLLLNPPISDTDQQEGNGMMVSAPPFALLRLGTWFRKRGCRVELVDCLRDPLLEGRLRRRVRRTRVCGNERQERLEKPIYHYGLDGPLLQARLRQLEPPDLIAISALFTWQGEAVREAIAACRAVHPGARIALGGNFATLCPEEAAATGPDEVWQGDLPGAEFLPTAIDLLPGPHDIDLLRLVKGCPHRCSFCVTHVLNDGRVQARTAEAAFAELKAKMKANGTRTFIFFDDFVLYRQAGHLDRFLDLVIAERLPVTLKFGLGFSAHLITESFAAKLRDAHVEHLAIGLETIDVSRSAQMRRPQHIPDFLRAVEILHDHGYRGPTLGAFCLMGLPDSSTDEILRAVLFLYHLGVTPLLTTYTLTPRSGDMLRYGDRVRGRSLEELAPGLWRFAHPGMRVPHLDAIYKYFHERYYPLERIADSPTADPVIGAMQKIIRTRRHLPENWD